MELKGKKLELDLEELMPLFVGNKQEAFRQIGEKLLNSVLEKEFESFIGASKHERSQERSDYRNGYKERQLKTTLGELNLLRPYARSGKFETKLFENYSRIDKALVSMIVESYLKGVSTRKVESVNWLQLWYKETLKINAGVKDATRWKSTTVFTGV